MHLCFVPFLQVAAQQG
uniref:Uncharacterized protein n=1 Tax=Anguilla anguilla TaxID=7936 RepID=A0A0E9RYB9_ANGAN